MVSPQAIDALLVTTFVSNVDDQTLALIAPMLNKSLNGRSFAIKRKAARIMHNMCKLVVEPANEAPFIPLLLPALNKVIEEVMDLEVRDVSKDAKNCLIKSIGEVGVDLASYDGTTPLPPLQLKSSSSSPSCGLDPFGPAGKLTTP